MARPEAVRLRPPAHTADAAPCTLSPILANPCRPWVGAAVNGYPNVRTAFCVSAPDVETSS